jgi:hypothetical protein
MFANGCELQLGTVTGCLSCGDSCGWACEASGCNDAAALSLGNRHSCALQESGRAVCWGQGSIVPTDVGSGYASIDVGDNQICAVTDSGSIHCGMPIGLLDGSSDFAAVTSLGGTAVQVSVGLDHACVVLSEGQVRCWGSNTYRQLGSPGEDRTTPVTAIWGAAEARAGYQFTCARTRMGTVRCWGSNYFGNLGNGTTGLTSPPVDVLDLDDVTSLAIGPLSLHACALRSDRTVWCWGSNSSGQLGNGSLDNQSSPVQVVGLNDAIQISAGSQHTCALRASGVVSCWGNNDDGRLGDGGSVGQTRPVRATVTDALAVHCGDAYSCALQGDGGVVCWGDNAFGQLGTASTIDSAAPVPVRAP